MLGLIHFNASQDVLQNWHINLERLLNCSMICLLRSAERYPFIVWASNPHGQGLLQSCTTSFRLWGRERDQPWCKNLCTYVGLLHRLAWWKVPGSIGDSAEPADPCFLSPVPGGKQCVDQFFYYWRWDSAERRPKGRAVSTYSCSSHLIPRRTQSCGWTGTILYASWMSILASRVPLPFCRT